MSGIDPAGLGAPLLNPADNAPGAAATRLFGGAPDLRSGPVPPMSPGAAPPAGMELAGMGPDGLRPGVLPGPTLWDALEEDLPDGPKLPARSEGALSPPGNSSARQPAAMTPEGAAQPGNAFSPPPAVLPPAAVPFATAATPTETGTAEPQPSIALLSGLASPDLEGEASPALATQAAALPGGTGGSGASAVPNATPAALLLSDQVPAPLGGMAALTSPTAAGSLPGTVAFSSLASPNVAEEASPAPYLAPVTAHPTATMVPRGSATGGELAPVPAVARLAAPPIAMAAASLPAATQTAGAAHPGATSQGLPFPAAIVPATGPLPTAAAAGATAALPGHESEVPIAPAAVRPTVLPGVAAAPSAPAVTSAALAPELLIPVALGRPASLAVNLPALPDALGGKAQPAADGPEAAPSGLAGGTPSQSRPAAGTAPSSGPQLPATPGPLARNDRGAPVLGLPGRVERLSAGPPAGVANPLVQAALAAPILPGHPADPAAFAAVLRLPGPIGFLLRQGAASGAALAVQQAWEAAVLGRRDRADGATATPVWARWGFAAARQLDALVERLTGRSADLAALAVAPDRPSRVAALLLGMMAELPVRAAIGPGMSEAALLGLGSDGVRPGLNGLIRIEEAHSLPAGATALTAAASRLDAPLLLAHLDAPPPSLGAVPLGAGLTLQAAPAGAGAPASVTIAWAGPEAASGVVAAPVLAQLATAVLDAVQRGGAAPSAASVLVPLDGGPPCGTVRLNNGELLAFGVTPGGQPAWSAAPSEARPSATLVLGGGTGAEGDAALEVLGAHVAYGERRAVPLDLAPAAAAVAAWRMDDTEARAVVNADGVGAALGRARRLYARLLGGTLLLDQVPPGHGFATWDGSPAWLGLAGIRKPAALGVLPGEAEPPRAEVLRAGDGTWLLERRGGREGRTSRQAYPANATDDLGFFEDALFGLPPDASVAPPGGAAGAFAARGFRHARGRMAATGGDALAHARTAEAWGLAARAWAGALERMARTGAGRLAARGTAPVQAGALREVAAWCGAVPAWHAARAAGIDRAGLLSAVDEADRASIARALAPGAALACLLGEPGTGAAVPESWPAPARLLATGDPAALADWGTEALSQATEGRPDTLGWSDALALAARLGRVTAQDTEHRCIAPSGQGSVSHGA